jgi:hypothetical protein
MDLASKNKGSSLIIMWGMSWYLTNRIEVIVSLLAGIDIFKRSGSQFGLMKEIGWGWSYQSLRSQFLLTYEYSTDSFFELHVVNDQDPVRIDLINDLQPKQAKISAGSGSFVLFWTKRYWKENKSWNANGPLSRLIKLKLRCRKYIPYITT